MLLSVMLLTVLAAESGPASGAPPPQAPTLSQVYARVDELNRKRDERGAFAEEERLLQSSLARWGQDYGILWRAARHYFWLSDDPGLPTDQRSRWGKVGWEYAERAVAVNPNDVAGHYWAAVCMGNYATGLGVIKAISKGLEGKFKDHLKRAGELGGGYQYGSIDVAWGRFYGKLPWPKRDRKKAEQHLRTALQMNGANLRARVYLADLYADSDRAAEAKRLLDEVTYAPIGRYDAPEERRSKALATGLAPIVLAKLK